MDDQAFRQFLQDHGDAVVKGDMGRVIADIDPSLHAQAAASAGDFPQDLQSAEVLSVEPDGERRRAQIRYNGASAGVVVTSVWDKVDTDQPLIVEMSNAPA